MQVSYVTLNKKVTIDQWDIVIQTFSPILPNCTIKPKTNKLQLNFTDQITAEVAAKHFARQSNLAYVEPYICGGISYLQIKDGKWLVVMVAADTIWSFNVHEKLSDALLEGSRNGFLLHPKGAPFLNLQPVPKSAL